MIAACNKDKKDGEDAAAEAAVADAAPEAEAPAASASAAPLASAPPVVVKTAPKPAPRADPPICALARNARARNSPTAPELEARCRTQGGTP